jgi:hypothetical protein
MNPPLSHSLQEANPLARRPSYARYVKHHPPVLPPVGRGIMMSLVEMT